MQDSTEHHKLQNSEKGYCCCCSWSVEWPGGSLSGKMEFKYKKHGEGPSVHCGVEILRIPTHEPASQDKYE